MALIAIGLALGWWVAKRRGEIRSGATWRVAVSLVLLGIPLGLGVADEWSVGFLILGLSLASLLGARLVVPGARKTQWHWPTVIFSFVIVPSAAVLVWAAFQI